MHYKSIIIELIDDQPQLALQLRGQKQMLATIEAYAVELKNRHEAWKKELSRTRPGSDPRQIAAEALELATQDLRERLHSASPKGETEPTLDAAMEFLRRHTPPV